LAPARPTPSTLTFGLVMFVICVTGFQFSADFWFGSVIPLTGDLIPSRLRGRTFMLNTIGRMTAGFIMMKLALPLWEESHLYPYLVPAAWCIFGFVSGLLIREPYAKPLPRERYNPLRYAAILTRNRDYLKCTLLASLFLAVIGVYMMFHVLFATEILGLSAADFGAIGSVGLLLAFVLAFPIGWLADRVSRKLLLVVGFCVFAGSCIVGLVRTETISPCFDLFVGKHVPLIGELTSAKLHLLTMWSIQRIGYQLINIPLQPFIFQYIPREVYGTVMGGIQLTRGASRFVATPIAGAICRLLHTIRASYGVALVCSVLGILTLSRMGPGPYEGD